MTTKRPYAPPAGADDVDADTSFDDLPSDVELNFNESPRDEYEPDDLDEEFNEDFDDEFEDDDDLVFVEDEGSGF